MASCVAPGVYYQARDEAGNSWFMDRDTADLLAAHYEASEGLYEVLFSKARQQGLRRRVRERRARRLQVAELKARAEW
jgi:hypothetical protein